MRAQARTRRLVVQTLLCEQVASLFSLSGRLCLLKLSFFSFLSFLSLLSVMMLDTNLIPFGLSAMYEYGA